MLGKISSVYYGWGGYQDAQFGISFVFEGKGWGVGDFWGFWGEEPNPLAKWSEKDQINWHGQTANRIAKLLKTAKVKRVEQLVDIPVKVNFKEDNSLSDWRILEEVL